MGQCGGQNPRKQPEGKGELSNAQSHENPEKE